MKRNKRTFYYALKNKIDSIQDESGYDTGEHRITYRNPVPLQGVVTGGSGEYERDVFGGVIDYDKMIVLDTLDCPIDEDTILFIDVKPKKDSNGDYLNDYVVKRCVTTLNFTFIAISSTVGAKQ
jgi:hypothetical protein